MNKGKFEQKKWYQRRAVVNRLLALALVLACGLLVGGVVGGTVAWLTDKSSAVTNTFTKSDIEITLSETKPELQTAPMVPGWTIDKDPKVKVDSDSEDCWLFVKINESVTPDLDAYIRYSIAEGWEIIQPTDSEGNPVTSIENEDEIVIGRRVYKSDTIKEFEILGAGNYTDPMGTDSDTKDGFVITWSENQVCVKPSVNEQMMDAIAGQGNQPTLSFQAYAVQLFKTNSDNNEDNTADEFTAAEAWAQTAGMNSGN